MTKRAQASVPERYRIKLAVSMPEWRFYGVRSHGHRDWFQTVISDCLIEVLEDRLDESAVELAIDACMQSGENTTRFGRQILAMQDAPKAAARLRRLLLKHLVDLNICCRKDSAFDWGIDTGGENDPDQPRGSSRRTSSAAVRLHFESLIDRIGFSESDSGPPDSAVADTKTVLTAGDLRAASIDLLFVYVEEATDWFLSSEVDTSWSPDALKPIWHRTKLEIGEEPMTFSSMDHVWRIGHHHVNLEQVGNKGGHAWVEHVADVLR